MILMTPVFRDYPYIDLYPYWVAFLQVGSILLFVGILFYLPSFMNWINEIEKGDRTMSCGIRTINKEALLKHLKKEKKRIEEHIKRLEREE